MVMATSALNVGPSEQRKGHGCLYFEYHEFEQRGDGQDHGRLVDVHRIMLADGYFYVVQAEFEGRAQEAQAGSIIEKEVGPDFGFGQKGQNVVEHPLLESNPVDVNVAREPHQVVVVGAGEIADGNVGQRRRPAHAQVVQQRTEAVRLLRNGQRLAFRRSGQRGHHQHVRHVGTRRVAGGTFEERIHLRERRGAVFDEGLKTCRNRIVGLVFRN
jgi:hypothetical protein